MYKPELWDKVQQLDMWTNKEDPVMTCQALGVPRQGPPRRIWQTENDITFLYNGGDAGGGYGEYRIIPIDGREHGPDAKFELNYMGNTVGKWEGDTLVLDSIGFIDTTWIGRGGYFHSEKMHVIEKFTREGDARRSRGVSGTVGVPDTSDSAQHRCGRGSDTGTWLLRNESGDRSSRDTDSALSHEDTRDPPSLKLRRTSRLVRRSARREGGSSRRRNI
jgi:hypothetical protein